MGQARISPMQVASVDDANRAISRLFDAVSALQNVQAANTASFTLVFTAGTPITIQHGLGRQPYGFTVTDSTVFGSVRRNSWTRDTIVLEASANGTYTVEVR